MALHWLRNQGIQSNLPKAPHTHQLDLNTHSIPLAKKNKNKNKIKLEVVSEALKWVIVLRGGKETFVFGLNPQALVLFLALRREKDCFVD
jgi:hypothetical protein